MSDSRTKKSLKNTQVALSFYCVNLILQFFSRKIFLNYLGAEVLGLNTTATNLLQFLNLAELGIGAAVGYSLYKPLADKNQQVVNEIVSVQGYLYRVIAFVILSGSAILMCFFPVFFAKITVPLWYTYATFIVLLFGSMAGYFFNYRQIVLTADQKEYKLTLSIQSIKTVKILMQIIAIKYSINGYIWWLILEVVATITSVFIINAILRKQYPWLNSRVDQGKILQTKYPQITIKTKQLFFHKIGFFAMTEVSPLIIYAFGSLTLVAIYGNYMLIVVGVMLLLNAIFNSINAGVGNLVAEGNEKRILCVFDELFSSRFLLVTTICYGVYMLSTPFVVIWVGEKYLLDNLSLLLIVIALYFNTIRSVVDSYINAYGLYNDVWIPITETLLNISLSILFGYIWGLPGILGVMAFSLMLVVGIWKPYFLFRYGLKKSLTKYIRLYIKHILILFFVSMLSYYITKQITIDPTVSYFNLILYGLITVGTFFLMLLSLLYVVEKGMRDFCIRVKSIVWRRK